VREKVTVEGSADPSLLSLGAKLGALERVVAERKAGLGDLMRVWGRGGSRRRWWHFES
jgi:hypothetical protein